MTDIILASQSPRRRFLLEQMGLRFSVHPAGLAETVEPGLSSSGVVLSLSRQKARAVALRFPSALVIAADTVVELNRDILGKPRDEEEAREMLRRLSGQTHRVYTGVALQGPGREDSFCEETEVTFRDLSEPEIAGYVRTGEPMDKAGAYGIQGYGALLVRGIRGDYFNVMGLPVCRLGLILKNYGVDCLGG